MKAGADARESGDEAGESGSTGEAVKADESEGTTGGASPEAAAASANESETAADETSTNVSSTEEPAEQAADVPAMTAAKESGPKASEPMVPAPGPVPVVADGKDAKAAPGTKQPEASNASNAAAEVGEDGDASEAEPTAPAAGTVEKATATEAKVTEADAAEADAAAAEADAAEAEAAGADAVEEDGAEAEAVEAGDDEDVAEADAKGVEAKEEASVGGTAGGSGTSEAEFDDGLPDNYMDMIIGLPKPVESAKVSEVGADDELDESQLAEHLPPNYDDIIIGLPKPKVDPAKPTPAANAETNAAGTGEGDAAENTGETDETVEVPAAETETVEALITHAVEANAKAEADGANPDDVKADAKPDDAEAHGKTGDAETDGKTGAKTKSATAEAAETGSPEGKSAEATAEVAEAETTKAETTDAKSPEAKSAGKADEGKAVAAKAVGGKSADAKAADPKSADAKTSEANAADAKTTDDEATNAKAADAETADVKTSEAKTTDAEAADAETAEVKTTDGKAAGGEAAGGKAAGAKAAGGKTAGAKTAGAKTAGAKVAAGKAAGGAGDDQTPAEQVAMALIAALMRLREALASSRLPIDVVGADEARQQQKAMLDQLDDYVLPRLVQLEAPVLAVVGGSTGAGKSTLVNTLVGRVVSEPGVLRPTTRSPVLVHNPADTDWFTGDRVLPGLARSTGDAPGGTEDAGVLRLVAADTIPQGLAVLDAPDIDSVVEANRELAAQLLAAADLWLFVTTAARYADAVPWDFLKDAAERSTAIAVVLDRVPPGSVEDISGHLAHMLLERGLGDSPMFAITESEVSDGGLLTPEVVAPVKEWLSELAEDAGARAAVVRRTLQGAVTAMTKKTPAFALAVQAQADTVIELRSAAETAYVRAVKDISKATQDGSMLRGEVLARWQEFVGTGELLKGLQTNVGRFRDKMRTAISGKQMPTRDVADAVESGLESLLREHAEAAAERAEESWQSTVAGRQLLEAGDRDLGRSSREFNAQAGRMVRDWQGYVLELVRKEGADKRSTARILAYGFNGLGIALMIVIFASTAGIPTGAEVGVGAGTAAVGQKLLEAVFGDQAVRTLATKARRDLDSRVRSLMDAELSRYLTVLDQHPVDPDAPRRLTEAARAVEDCT